MVAYLDNAATTRLHPEARAAMERAADSFANPSSVHRPGREARKALDAARAKAAGVLGAAPEEICFLSGATEADNLAVLGTARRRGAPGHLVTTAVEHSAVLEPCRHLRANGWTLDVVSCDAAGRVAPDAVAAALRPDTALVSVMLANNETGTLQPVREIAALCRARGVTVHCDAAQAGGKLRVRPDDLGVDLLTLSAHKMHGPRGAGLLWVRAGVALQPLLFGGGHEGGLRAGTENVVAAAGFAAALEVAERDLDENVARMERLRGRLREGLASIPGLKVNGHDTERLPSVLSVSIPDVEAEAAVLLLDGKRVCVSSGSACMAASVEPSHVLRAMGIPDALARGTLRLSVAADTTDDDVAKALEAIPDAVARLRSLRT